MARAGLGMVPAPREITLEELKKRFPRKKHSITEDTVDVINAAMYDPEFDTSTFINDMITYENIMLTSSLDMEEYVDAIRYCAYLQSNPDSKLDAYKRTFARREFVQARWDVRPGTKEYNELTSAATRYDKLPHITKLKTQSMVPMHILFQGMAYGAIRVLATEMETAPMPRDRIAAAKELLAAVKPPENLKIEMDIGVKENSAIQSLNEQLASFASNSLVHLQAGTTDLNRLGSMKVKEEIIDCETE